MKQLRILWCWPAVSLLVTTVVLLSGSLGGMASSGADSPETATPAWAAPGTTAIRKVSPVDGRQHEPIFLNNLDCDLLTYRDNTSNMRSGCFTETAFGLIDSDSDTVLFNGTDEGLPLLAYSAHEILAPWPKALNLVALDPVSTGGSYINLYKNPLAAMHDQRDAALQLTGKILAAPPELTLKDTAGTKLVINAQTMAFSSNGSWLVAETLTGSFVRINLATLDITAFAPAFGSPGSPAPIESRVAVSDDGQYVAIVNQAAGLFKVYDLTACGHSVPVGLPADYECPQHDYAPFVEQHIESFRSVRHLRFVNEGLLSFEAQTGDSGSSGVYELAPTDKITSLIDYLGLGDSYTSGEGAFNYEDGTDTPDDMCHLSAHSYSLLLIRDVFSGVGGHSVACSGATINDVGSASPGYHGQVKHVGTLQQLQQTQAGLLNSVMTNYLPGYVAQQRFVQQYQPAIMTVSVGGNDIGFGDIMQRCVLPHVRLHLSDNDCYNTYEDRQELLQLIDRTVPRWTGLYRQLAAEAPGARLYAVGYPDTVYDGGNCALNVHLSRNELAFVEELTDYLNTAISQAAANAGVAYVDISDALAGHRLCETANYNTAVNGLTAGTDAGILGLKVFAKESYHPNALGQGLMEQAILQETHSFNSTSGGTSGGSDSHSLLNAPKTGRVINKLTPDDNLTTEVAAAGQTIPVEADGLRAGLAPNTVYFIRLDGPAGPIIGAMNSGTNSSIVATATLPGNITGGSHTIDITGNNQAGEPVDVTQPIYVPGSDGDADDDGIPDILDTCPGAVNSGQDSDQDGIDDTCDPLIGLPGAPPPEESFVGSVVLVGNVISASGPP